MNTVTAAQASELLTATRTHLGERSSMKPALAWAEANSEKFHNIASALGSAVSTLQRLHHQPTGGGIFNSTGSATYIGFRMVRPDAYWHLVDRKPVRGATWPNLWLPEGGLNPAIDDALRAGAILVQEGERRTRGKGTEGADFMLFPTYQEVPSNARLMGVLVNVIGGAAAPTMVERPPYCDKLIEAGIAVGEYCGDRQTRETFADLLGPSGLNWLQESAFSPELSVIAVGK